MKFLRLVFPSSFFRKNQLKKPLESNVSDDKKNEEKKSSESNVSIPKQDESKQCLGDNISMAEQKEMEQTSESNVSLPKQDEMERSLANVVSMGEHNEMEQCLGNNVFIAEQNAMEQSLGNNVSVAEHNEMEESPGNKISIVEQSEMEQSVESNASIPKQSELKLSVEGMPKDPDAIVTSKPMETMPDETFLENPRFLGSIQNSSSDLDELYRTSSGFNKTTIPISNTTPAETGKKTKKKKKKKNQKSRKKQKDTAQGTVNLPDCTEVADYQTPTDGMENPISNKGRSAVILKSEGLKPETKSLDESSCHHDSLVVPGPGETSITKILQKPNEIGEEANRDANTGEALSDFPESAPIQNVDSRGMTQALAGPLGRHSFTNRWKQPAKDSAHYIRQEAKKNAGVRQADDKSYSHQQSSVDANSPDMSGLLTPQCTERCQSEQSMGESQIIDHELHGVAHIPQLESPESVSQQSSLGQCKSTSRTDDTVDAGCVTVHEGDHVTTISKHIPELVGGSFDENTVGHSASNDLVAENSRCIGAEMAVQTLNAAYMLQLASDCFQFVTGRPIAEFDKMLYSASPVLVYSFALPHGWGSIGNEPTSIPWCELKNLKVKLKDVWSWYEDSSSLGLAVNVDVPQKIERKGIQLTAHFTPFLSAVQLFGCSHHSSAGSAQEDFSSKLTGKSGTAQNAVLTISCPEPAADMNVSDVLDLMGKYMMPVDIASSSGKNCSISNSSLDTFDDPELIFEYFEHQRPHERRPLYQKIKELSNYGASNPQVYGDPSKLIYMDLQDLHPASWFAVAWYPIYSIPATSNLRAAFLTYHSFGHLVLRHIKSKVVGNTAVGAVCPVLGMQIYKAKDEGWLNANNPPESFRKAGIYIDSSRIVKERLRTLRESAAVYSTGHVRKNQKTVSNRHPDFEYLSRWSSW